MKNVTLIGAGLVGSLLSIYLSRKGYRVRIYERRPDMRLNRISAGRSINLALSERGWRGLEGVGLVDEIKKVALPMSGRIMHSRTSELSYQAYGKEGQAINSVSRGGLNCVLMDLAEKEGVEIFFNHRCTQLDIPVAHARFENSVSGEMVDTRADFIVASDGAFSAGRLAMQLSTDRFQYQQYYLEHGYKELTIPPLNGDFAMDPTALHIWPRGSFMLIALPNLDKSFTLTLFFPFEGDPSFKSLDTEEKMLAFFEDTFPDALKLMPDIRQEYFRNPAASLVTVRCSPWNIGDKLLLIGDAAHAIVPFYGQGMNCGFEDCAELSLLLDRYPDDLKEVFTRFSELRKPDADAIADLAIANFIEMRDKVGQPAFLLQKKIEAWFSEKYPDLWIPLYTMVSFRPDVRYSTALNEGNKQERIMREVMKDPQIAEKWNHRDTEQLILRLINEYKSN